MNVIAEGARLVRRFLIVFILFSILCFIVYDSIKAVPDGYVGVETFRVNRLGPLSTAPRALTSGLHLSLPLLTRLHLYNTRVQMLILQVPVGAGKVFQMTAQVRLDPDSAVALHLKRGPDYMLDSIKPWLTELMKGKIFDSRGRMDSPEQQAWLLDTVEQDLSLDGLSLERAFLTRLEHLELGDAGGKAANADEESDTDEDQD